MAKVGQEMRCIALNKLRIHHKPEAPALLKDNPSTYQWGSRFCFCGAAVPSFLSFCSGKTLHTNSWEATLPDTTQNDQVSNYFWKDWVPLQTFPLLHTTALSGKKNAHMVYRRVYKRNKCLNFYLISKVQSTQQGNNIQKTKDWSFGIVTTVSFVPLAQWLYHWFESFWAHVCCRSSYFYATFLLVRKDALGPQTLGRVQLAIINYGRIKQHLLSASLDITPIGTVYFVFPWC